MQPKDWLPDNARSTALLQRALASHLQAWGTHWFGEECLQVREIRRGTSRPVDGIRDEHAGGVIVASVAARDAVAERSLRVDLRAGELSGFDREMLDDAVSTILGDLLRRIGAGQEAAGDGAAISLVLAGAEFTLHLQDNQINEVIKAGLPRHRANGVLVTRERALRPARVSVEAVAGSAELSADELAGIAVGDVILLDRAVASGVDLLVRGRPAPIARAKLGQDDGRAVLRVTQIATSR